MKANNHTTTTKYYLHKKFRLIKFFYDINIFDMSSGVQTDPFPDLGGLTVGFENKIANTIYTKYVSSNKNVNIFLFTYTLAGVPTGPVPKLDLLPTISFL